MEQHHDRRDRFGAYNSNGGRPRKYTFDRMSVGEKQFFALEFGTIRDLQNRLMTSAKLHGSFKSRRISRGGSIGVLVERV